MQQKVTETGSPPALTPPPTLTCSEAAALLRTSPRDLARRCHIQEEMQDSGQAVTNPLPFYRLGRRLRFRREGLEEWERREEERRSREWWIVPAERRSA